MARHNKKRKIDGAAPANGKVEPSKPKKQLPSVVVNAFPGPRTGFLLEHKPNAIVGGAGAPATEDAVAADSAYISALIGLIPPEFYVPKTDEEKEATWTKYAKVQSCWRPFALRFRQFGCHCLMCFTWL